MRGKGLRRSCSFVPTLSAGYESTIHRVIVEVVSGATIEYMKEDFLGSFIGSKDRAQLLRVFIFNMFNIVPEP